MAKTNLKRGGSGGATPAGGKQGSPLENTF